MARSIELARCVIIKIAKRFAWVIAPKRRDSGCYKFSKTPGQTLMNFYLSGL